MSFDCKLVGHHLLDPPSQMLIHQDLAQEMQLYLCWDSEGIQETEDLIVESLFRAADEGDTESEQSSKKRSKDKKKKKKKSSSSSESDSTASSEALVGFCWITVLTWGFGPPLALDSPCPSIQIPPKTKVCEGAYMSGVKAISDGPG